MWIMKVRSALSSVCNVCMHILHNWVDLCLTLSWAVQWKYSPELCCCLSRPAWESADGQTISICIVLRASPAGLWLMAGANRENIWTWNISHSQVTLRKWCCTTPREMQAEFRLVGYKMFSLLSRSAWRLNLTTRLQLEGLALSIVTHTQLPEISCSSVIRNHRE